MPSATVPQPRAENLALIFQEMLTATVRLRANRQAVSDSESFRANMREAIRTADAEARKRGYAPEDFKVALFGAVAFLDESILNSRNPLFSDWPRKPLQEEIFGGHVAGEIFFQNVDRMLSAPETEVLADVLEVYQLCLLLGYLGRYSVSGRGEVRAVRDSIADKIRRIRPYSPALSPSWAPAAGETPSQRDVWLRRWVYSSAVCFLLMVGLYASFKVSLSHGASQLAEIAAGNR